MRGRPDFGPQVPFNPQLELQNSIAAIPSALAPCARGLAHRPVPIPKPDPFVPLTPGTGRFRVGRRLDPPMRPELKRLILNARARLGGGALSAEQEEENARRQAIEDFQILLAGKINIMTRFELLLKRDYVWLENRPAARFEIDGHTFLIAAG